MNLLFTLQRYRFIWLNLLFAGYLWWIQPAVLQRLIASEQRQSPDWVMGSILLGIQVIEIVGMLFKRPVSAFYARRYPDSNPPGSWQENVKVILFIFTPIFHIGLASVLTIVALGLLKMGVREETATVLQCLSLLLFFAVLMKEAFFVTLMLGIGVAGSTYENAPTSSHTIWVDRLNRWLSPPVAAQLTHRDILKDITGDLLLLIFTALAYTSAWDSIVASSPLHAQGIDRLFEILGVSLFFFMVYFANRSIYLMQELSIQQSQTTKTFAWISLLAIWLSALWPLLT
ncbi:MAG: hypothetical protein L6461_11235 [Anaerolineae bacterium]|nr:hypothetical protein [Anaerolineae bacterium]